MGNIETTTKFSRLKSISSTDFLVFLVFFYFTVIYLFSVPLYKGKLSSFIVKKMFTEIRFKGFFNLSVFGLLFLYNYKEKPWSFMVKKMFIEIRLCSLMTYVFKGHVKIVKIYMVKFNVSILNRLKIMVCLQIQSKYINIVSFLIKL